MYKTYVHVCTSLLFSFNICILITNYSMFKIYIVRYSHGDTSMIFIISIHIYMYIPILVLHVHVRYICMYISLCWDTAVSSEDSATNKGLFPVTERSE